MSRHHTVPKSLQGALQDHSLEGIVILSSEASRLTRGTIYLLFGVLVAGLLWSFFGTADVMVKAEGRLGPEANERFIYTPVEGRLVDLFVVEGSPVVKGDVVARVHALGAVQLATAALAAELKLDAAEEALAIYPAQRRALEKQLETIAFQIESAEQAHELRVAEGLNKLAEEQKLKLAKAQVKLEEAQQKYDFAKSEWNKYRRLSKRPGGGGVSRSQVEEKRNEFYNKSAELELAETALGEFEVELAKQATKKRLEIQAKSEELLNLYAQREEKKAMLANSRSQVESALEIARAEATGANRITFDDLDEENFLLIRAPVSGVVTQLAHTQPGAQAEPKTPLIGIAPENVRQVVHVEIHDRDRAFLKEGMPVKLKFSAFPYQRFGFIDGTLDYLSPSASPSAKSSAQNQILVYKGRVTLDRTYYETEGGATRVPLRYGMTAMAEIVVRKRRLIDLALDPFRNAVS